MRLEDEKLQRYFDGELDEAEAEEVAKAIASSEDDRARLEQLGRLRDFVRMAMEGPAAEDLGSDALFDRVRAGIANSEPPAAPGPALRVVEGGAARRRNVWIGAGAVVALAAGILLAILIGDGGTGAPVSSRPRQEPLPEPIAVVEEGPHGSEVEQVDFGENTGTVFAVEGDSGEPIAVVWINDDEVPQ